MKNATSPKVTVSAMALNRVALIGIVALVSVRGNSAEQSPGKTVPEHAWPLVQIEHLVGDHYAGFKQSCVLVYSDGHYHREARRQTAIDGRPTGDWQPAQVYEGIVPVVSLQKLSDAIEAEDFKALGLTVGDFTRLRSSVLFGPRGVIPQSDIEIVEASVARSTKPQIFEAFLGTTHLQSSLQSFITWVDETEKRTEGRLVETAANNCATSPLIGKRSPWEPTTSLMAKPIYTPGPDYPMKERKAKHMGKVLVEILVNVDGSVGVLSMKQRLNPELDREALGAIKNWKFVPALLIGVPVAVSEDVEVAFNLD